MKGLELFPSLRELNLSSNSLISMAYLDQSAGCLPNLELLNLSCNKIT